MASVTEAAPITSPARAQLDRERDARLAATDAVWQRLKWHKDEQTADREHDLSAEEEVLVREELDDFISRAANDVAILALSAYDKALHPPPTGKCSVCGWALVDAADQKAGKCIHHRIKDELAARDRERMSSR